MPKTSQVSPDPELLPITDATDWEAVPDAETITTAPRLGARILVRLDPDVAWRVRRAAGMTGLTQSEFARRATLRAAAEVLGRNPLAITVAPNGDAPPILSNVGKGATVQPRLTSVSAVVKLG